MMIDSKQKISKTNDVIVSNMGQDKVMLSISNGKYYNLGELGGDIWDRISEPKPIHQLISELIKDYDVDKLICEQHVLTFLQQLLEEELIKIN
jgi:hypothetical protein